MIKSKESQIYLGFFVSSLPIILVFGFTALFISIFYLNSKPQQYIGVEDFKMEYIDENLGDRINLTDQAVSEVRSQVLQNKIGVEELNDIKIYKSGPILINLTDTGENQESLNMDIKNINDYLTTNFPLSSVGTPVYKLTPKPFLVFGLISFGIGSLIGLLISLIKSYFKNY